MCGIAGLLSHNKISDIDIKNTKEMGLSIQHRGPDSSGTYEDGYVCLIHNRLSILDIKGGMQPMFSLDRNFIIVFNGEIFNYLELRTILKAEGFNFRTNTDTEVVLYSYIFWGIDCLNKFNGMWAFAIWDKSDRTLFISRDRFGIKPLYFYESQNKFIFASEIKAIKKIINPKINSKELIDQFVFGPKYGGKTHFEDINELEPGCFIIMKEKKLLMSNYYSLENTFMNKMKKYDIDYINYIISDSVKIRLLSDVPLGTLNSGGLDSSLISYYAKQNYNLELNTFSIAPELKFGRMQPGDETGYAELLAQTINSKHHSIRYTQDDFMREIDNAIYFNDGLMFHSNSIALSILFKDIKQKYNTTVVLGGEGADEIFRGYDNNQYYFFYSKARNKLLKILYRFLINNKFPNIIEYYSLTNKSELISLLLYLKSHFSFSSIKMLLNEEVQLSEDRKKIINRMSNLSEEDQGSFYDQTCYLMGLLQRVDRMSMMRGVEARVPFLDYRLVDYVNKIPLNQKSGLNRNKNKIILKKLSRNKLPNEIIERPKYGFATPIKDWRSNIISKLHKIDNRINYNHFKDSEILLTYCYLKMLEMN